MNKPKLTAKEAIMQIGNLLKMDFAKVEKFESAKLADGTEIMWDGELSEGTAIMVVAEDGNQMPAPDAAHELEDGTIVTTVGGLVTSIEPKKEKEVEVEVELAVAPDMSKLEERIMACEAKMTAMETKMAEMFSAVESKFASINESNVSKFEEISKIVEEIAAEPIVVAPKPSNSTFSKKERAMTTVERIAEFKKLSNK
jgi:preprotein translocase subunit YajC